MADERELLASSKAWPVTEALRLLERVKRRPPEKGFVLFETGYGPSGLPHIGTFAEVFRTTLIRHAFRRLSDLPTELYAFSDDMDGLRKVPDNVPNKEMVAAHLGQPLTSIPDPFGTHEFFGAHMNARLRAFLDAFGFEYTFKSSTECYRSGVFDRVLLTALERHEQIVKAVTPILGQERASTYSPFLPLSPKTGRVLQARIEETRPGAGTVVFRDEDGTLTEVPVTGGHCKMQWRADWAMRWTALEVDYEMSGKDLTDSVRIGSQICRVLGGTPPENLTYELFLDEQGEKISKSKGNGLTIEEWLRYATPESLELFLYKDPKKAKRLYFDVIPRHVDEYEQLLEALPRQEPEQRLDEPRLAHPRRRPARRPAARRAQLRHAAQPRERRERRRPGRALGLHLALRAGRLARDLAPPRRPGRARRRLLPRLRPAGEALPRADRAGAGGAGRAAALPARRARGHGRRDHPARGLRDRQAPRLRQPARLVPRPLRGPARPERGAALRLLRRRLRRRPTAWRWSNWRSPARRRPNEPGHHPPRPSRPGPRRRGRAAARPPQAGRRSRGRAPAPARPRAQAAAVHDHGPPGGARRARPGAGPRAAAVRRGVPAAPRPRAAGGARPRLRPPPGHDRAAAPRADRQGRPAPPPLPAEVGERHQHAAARRRPAPLPQHAGPRRGRRDGAAGPARARPRGADAERRAAQGGGRGTEAAGGPGRRAAEHAPLAVRELGRGLRRGHGPRHRRGAPGRAAARPLGQARRGALGDRARRRAPPDRHAQAPRRRAWSRPCRASRRAPGGSRTRRPPCRPS